MTPALNPERLLPDLALPAWLTERQADGWRDEAYEQSFFYPHADGDMAKAWFRRQADRIDVRIVPGDGV